MLNVKSIKRKSKVTNNVIDITGALQIVSAIRMRKAQAIVKSGNPYVGACLTILHSVLEDIKNSNIANGGKAQKKTEAGTPSKPCFLIVSSDKGLCGAFNANVLKRFNDYCKEHHLTKDTITVITVGRYGYNILKRRGYTIIGHFEKFHDVVTSQEIVPIYQDIFKKFSEGQFSRLYAIYSDFISSLKNKVEVRQLLPLQYESVIGMIAELGIKLSERPKSGEKKECIFEPNPQAVLERLTSFLFQIEIFYIITESNATEHSLRMMAMDSANENAHSFLRELTMMFNKVRQERITSELIEITAAKEIMG